MTPRQWLPLVAIAIAVFIVNMSEFMPIGLLTDIATDMGVSESETGLIISIYAWSVAIISLPLMLLLRRMDYRTMLLMCTALFVVFQILSGISSSYAMLIVSRLGVSVAHAIFWSIAAALAVKVVQPGYERVALSTVAAGTSVAMIVGIPLGRIIGLALGWRMTFVSMAVIGIALLIILVLVFPKVENPGTFTVRRLPEILRNRVILGIYVLLVLYVMGYYTGYSYIEPFLQQVAGLSEGMTTVALTLFGFAGVLASVLFARLYDRTRLKYLVLALTGTCLSLLLLEFSAMATVAVLAVMAVFGLSATAVNISLQNETLRASPQDATAITMAMFSSLFNMGIALGSLIGGGVTDTAGVSAVGYAGGAFLVTALVFALVYVVRRLREAGEPSFRRGPPP